MIIGYAIVIGASALVFLALRGRTTRIRIIVSTLVFLTGTGVITALTLFSDDPPKESTPVDQDILDREGVSPEEWEEYRRKNANEIGRE